VAYGIDLSEDGIPEAIASLSAWAQKDLKAELDAAAEDPHRLPALPSRPASRILAFADGRGICLLEVDEERRRIALRQIQPPR
jgi:hypothetical protein